MPKAYAMLVDTERCIGCNACVVECQREWEIPKEAARLRIERKEAGKFPATFLEFIRRSCQHCDEAPCVDVCPTGASYKTEEGFVEIDYDKCVGCKMCIEACPYNARQYREDMKAPEKCTWCLPRVKEGKQPVCVTKCPQDALVFGERSEMISRGTERVAELKAKGYSDAVLFKENNLGGLGVMYVLTEKPSKFGLPEDVGVPLSGVLLNDILKPAGAIAGGATLAALAVSFLANLGYKREAHDEEGGEE